MLSSVRVQAPSVYIDPYNTEGEVPKDFELPILHNVRTFPPRVTNK